MASVSIFSLLPTPITLRVGMTITVDDVPGPGLGSLPSVRRTLFVRRRR